MCRCSSISVLASVRVDEWNGSARDAAVGGVGAMQVVLVRDKNRGKEDVVYYFPGWGLSEFVLAEDVFNSRWFRLVVGPQPCAQSGIWKPAWRCGWQSAGSMEGANGIRVVVAD